MPRGRAGPYDVAIVGFGPTGAALANLLGLCGLRVVVLERERAIHCLPRAVHFDGEVMRIFQAIGVSERVARVSRINAGMRFIDPHGKLLLDWPRPQQVGPQGWHPSYRFHQPDLEAILRYRLSSVPNVDVVLGADVTAIAQDAELGSITYREGDRQHTLTARYVVGCDGARSLVRAQITNQAEDLGFHERWLVVDLLPHGDRPDLGDFTIQYCHPQTPATYPKFNIHTGDARKFRVISCDSCRSTKDPALKSAQLAKVVPYSFETPLSAALRTITLPPRFSVPTLED